MTKSPPVVVAPHSELDLIEAALANVLPTRVGMVQTLETAGSKPHRKQAPDLTGWERIVEADKVNKVLPKHGTDRLPVEDEDFRRLPEILANPDRQHWEEVPGLSPVLRSEIDEGHKTIVIEEAYTGKHQLTILSIYRP